MEFDKIKEIYEGDLRIPIPRKIFNKSCTGNNFCTSGCNQCGNSDYKLIICPVRVLGALLISILTGLIIYAIWDRKVSIGISTGSFIFIGFCLVRLINAYIKYKRDQKIEYNNYISLFKRTTK